VQRTVRWGTLGSKVQCTVEERTREKQTAGPLRSAMVPGGTLGCCGALPTTVAKKVDTQHSFVSLHRLVNTPALTYCGAHPEETNQTDRQTGRNHTHPSHAYARPFMSRRGSLDDTTTISTLQE